MPKAMLSKLPDKAHDIYEAAWQAALDKGYDEEKAAKIAIGAVKNAGYHKDDESGMWIKMHTIGWHITKATLDNGIMRWHGTVSKFAIDVQGDEITPQFINYAWRQVEKGLRPAPVICISHIDHGLPSDAWVAGDTEVIYVDGQIPKAKGTFRDTPLGRAAFAAVRDDIKADRPEGERVKFSMGFYNEGSHVIKSRQEDGTEIGGLRYYAGWIKHLALTRVPVVKETSVKAHLEVKSMAKPKITKRDDAATIVGDELADELAGAAEKADLEDTELILKQEQEEAKQKANVKTEDGQEFGKGAYLYTPEPDQPSTWKLRIEENPGEVTVAQLGRAAAALTKGFRGQKAEMPADEKKAAAKKLVSRYRGQDVADEDIPEDLWGAADMKPPKKEKSVSMDQFPNRIRDSWRAQFPDSDEAKLPASDYSWVQEVLDDSVIVERKGKLYRAPYIIDAETGAITFGALLQVQEIKTFVPVEIAPQSSVIPQVATKAEVINDPGASRRDQVKALLGALETLLLEGLDEQAEEANRAALGSPGTNPPTTVEMSQAQDIEPSAQSNPLTAAMGEPLTPEETAIASFVDDWGFRVKSVLLSEWDRTQKFEALQHALNEFGEGVRDLVKEKTPPSGRDMAEVISQAVRQAVEPVYNELAGVKAQLADLQDPKNRPGAMGIMQPKAMDGRAVVMQEQPNQTSLPQAMPQGVGRGTALRNKALSASELAWMSTAEGPGLRR